MSTTEKHRELIQRLGQIDAPANIAAELANDGVVEALPAILWSIVADCGLEIIPHNKIDAYITLASPLNFPELFHELESLDESKLDDDAGDIEDEFWRIQQSIEKILVGIGSPVKNQIEIALTQTENSFSIETLKKALATITS